jgi:hypothetical protein
MFNKKIKKNKRTEKKNLQLHLTLGYEFYNTVAADVLYLSLLRVSHYVSTA